jgi:transposase
MGRAYSQDLWDRVIDAGTSARAGAVRGVGVATAIVWTRRARETGERSARKQGQPKRVWSRVVVWRIGFEAFGLFRPDLQDVSVER